MSSTPRFRLLEVPAVAAGMRLDHFLSRRFRDFSRNVLAKGIRAGQVILDGRTLRPGYRVKTGESLQIFIAGLAPDSDPPPLPPVLHEADGLVVVNKPPGMLCHPAGSAFCWALIGLARERWPAIELVHRIDRHTSGCLALTTDHELNRALKIAVIEGRMHKSYTAICKGEIPWESKTCDGAIGSDGGIVRIKMAVRDEGKHARTDVTVIGRQPGLTLVRCRIHTGRTHQIRVHLSHEGFPLLGDRLYGVEPEVFLHTIHEGLDETVLDAVGAPRHALHAANLIVPHPNGPVNIEAPLPEDMQRWWDHPDVLPGGGP